MMEELKRFETALIANTISRIDPTPAYQWYMGGSIRSVTPPLGPTVGTAVTCVMDSSTPGGAPNLDPYWRQVDQMQRMRPPIIWVVKAAGSRPDHECVLGDGMAKNLYAAGCVGVVTDGGVRDIAGLLQVPFAAYSRGIVVHHEALRIMASDEPVEIGGITVHSGDVIHADAEGVIKIPPACLPVLAERTSQMRAAEEELHRIYAQRDLESGEKRRRAGEVFARFGFAASPAAPGRVGPERDGVT
jgi:regulator of RNase E activity RraA